MSVTEEHKKEKQENAKKAERQLPDLESRYGKYRLKLKLFVSSLPLAGAEGGKG